MKVESNCMQSSLYFHTNQTLVVLTDIGKVPQKADTFSACTAGVGSHRKHRKHRNFQPIRLRLFKSPAEMAEMAEIIYNWSDYEYNPHGLGRSPISAISAISAGLFKYQIITWIYGTISRIG